MLDLSILQLKSCMIDLDIILIQRLVVRIWLLKLRSLFLSNFLRLVVNLSKHELLMVHDCKEQNEAKLLISRGVFPNLPLIGIAPRRRGDDHPPSRVKDPF